MCEPLRQPVHERQPRVHLEREPAVRRRHERAARHAQRLGDEAPLLLAPADVLDHGVRERDVEGAVLEGQREGVALDVARLAIALAETLALVQPERGDPRRPGVELLEEVERAAARVLAEAEVVDSDVEHRRLLGRRHRLHEEAELPPPGAERDAVGQGHRRSRVRCEPVLQDVVRPRGPYRLHVSTYGRRVYEAALPGGRRGEAWQGSDGLVRLRAPDEESLALLRFMLALDADTTEFTRRFRHDPLLGPSIRGLHGLRPPRRATVAHALLRAVCGQLIEARRALAIERAIIRACGDPAPDRHALGALSPAQLRRLGLATSPRLDTRPRSAARSTSRPCERCRSTRSRRGCCASAVSARGRSA